jgi:hypothetical protein
MSIGPIPTFPAMHNSWLHPGVEIATSFASSGVAGVQIRQ